MNRGVYRSESEGEENVYFDSNSQSEDNRNEDSQMHDANPILSGVERYIIMDGDEEFRDFFHEYNNDPGDDCILCNYYQAANCSPAMRDILEMHQNLYTQIDEKVIFKRISDAYDKRIRAPRRRQNALRMAREANDPYSHSSKVGEDSDPGELSPLMVKKHYTEHCMVTYKQIGDNLKLLEKMKNNLRLYNIVSSNDQGEKRINLDATKVIVAIVKQSKEQALALDRLNNKKRKRETMPRTSSTSV